MHAVHGQHGRRHDERPEPDERERMLDAVGWAALFIWVGAAWLAGLDFGYILLGLGIVTLLDQAARYVFGVRVEAFWVLIGCGFFVAGYWELWNLDIPVAPVLLILAGIGLLVWQFLLRRR
jgi:hypothetical protein